jgi:hypothetical protein
MVILHRENNTNFQNEIQNKIKTLLVVTANTSLHNCGQEKKGQMVQQANQMYGYKKNIVSLRKIR